MEHTNENLELFKIKTHVYLQGLTISDLRALGRYVGLQKPTALKKSALIDSIIQTFCGELLPARNTKGAPAKPHYLNPQIFHNIDLIKKECSVEYLQTFFSPTATIPAPEYEHPINQPKQTASSAKPVPPVQIVIQISDLSSNQKEKLNEFLRCL